MSWDKAKWIPSSLCIVGAIVLGASSFGGWGWFLFVAILFAIDW